MKTILPTFKAVKKDTLEFVNRPYAPQLFEVPGENNTKVAIVGVRCFVYMSFLRKRSANLGFRECNVFCCSFGIIRLIRKVIAPPQSSRGIIPVDISLVSARMHLPTKLQMFIVV